MLPSEIGRVPWPALLVSARGVVLAASPAAVSLLGLSPSHITELEDRFELLSTSGQPVTAEEHPLRRAMRTELFEVGGIWRDRESGRAHWLRFRGRAVGADGLLEIDSRAEDAERRAIAQLAKLNEALLGRTPGQGFISIPELLSQLVLLACEITGARFGALGVLRRDGKALQDFIYIEVPPETADAIGHLPTGKGLLGAVISEARTMRVGAIAKDPRSSGFPPGHPPMSSFLGVPLRVGDEVFGNFYLTEKQGADQFTDEDARILERFSSQAALTVAYARQAEEEERRIFEAVVHHAPNGIVYFPADSGGEVLGNPAAERMLGRVTRANDRARTYEIMHPDLRPMAEHDLPSSRALRGETVINLEVLVERRGLSTTPVLASAAPVRSDSGVRLGAVVVFQDITALKELQRVREDFMALVAHDLRTPLQSVLLSLEVLLRRSSGDPASVPISTLQSMKQNSRRLDLLVRGLLDASQIDVQGVVLDWQPVDLAALVRSLVSQVEGTLETHTVVVDVAGALPLVQADPLRLEQVLTNLLENAAKYSREGTPIRVVIAPAEKGATISVEDQGPGISTEEMPRLFDRYFQTQRARAKRRGLGLGLYIARGLVDAHGGSLTAESTQGKGSIFRIWLPIAKA